MGNALETELVGVTFDKNQLSKIDKLLEQMNISLPKLRKFNRQDFVRMAVDEKLEQLPKKEG